jgi:hypothetical protein
VDLLGDEEWHGRIFTRAWQRSAGGDAAVVAPVTGKELCHWLVQEGGGIPGKAYFELGHAVQLLRSGCAAVPVTG